MPYKGSKNAIAEFIVGNLPRAHTFCDLFFGGGAITHRALLSRKYEKFIVNDIDGRLPKFFLDCAHGKYTTENHREWVMREMFEAHKNDDAYIALIWSFGNNGKDYLYGRDIEDMKHAYHKAVYENDLDGLAKYGIKLTLSRKPKVYDRYLDYQRQIKQQKPDVRTELENIERYQIIERLESLYRLQSLQSDYQSVPIPEGALIYCDPPYAETNCGKYDGFDSERFYEWADRQDNIFISEYTMPDNFIPIAEIEKPILSTANGTTQKAVERLYTNGRTWEAMDEDTRLMYRCNMAEQIAFAF